MEISEASSVSAPMDPGRRHVYSNAPLQREVNHHQTTYPGLMNFVVGEHKRLTAFLAPFDLEGSFYSFVFWRVAQKRQRIQRAVSRVHAKVKMGGTTGRISRVTDIAQNSLSSHAVADRNVRRV